MKNKKNFLSLISGSSLLFLCIFVSPVVRAGHKEGKNIPFTLDQNEAGPNLSNRDLRNQVESLLLDKTNDFRSSQKLSILKGNSILEKAARYHSEDMLKRNYLSHFSPEGLSVLERIRKFKPNYDESCGENIHNISSPRGLKDPKAIAEQMMKDWIGSPSHRKNLVSKDYALLGVGCATDGNRIFCTQVFSGPEI